MITRNHIRARLSLLMFCLPMFGCGGDEGPSPPPPVPTADVKIVDAAFISAKNATQNPAIDTIAAGNKVRWTWVNPGPMGTHNVRPSAGSPTFLGSADLTGTGTTFTATFANPGTYYYECTLHAAVYGMTGRIVVQ